VHTTLSLAKKSVLKSGKAFHQLTNPAELKPGLSTGPQLENIPWWGKNI